MARDFFATASGIMALVLTSLGSMFALTGFAFALLVSPQQAGIAFLIIGVALLIIGIAMGVSRLKSVQKKALLISQGRRCSATIQSVEINRRVRVNRRHPSIITYKYRFEGREYLGRDIAFDVPPHLTPGSIVEILVSADEPDASAIDPKYLTGGGAGKSRAF